MCMPGSNAVLLEASVCGLGTDIQLLTVLVLLTTVFVQTKHGFLPTEFFVSFVLFASSQR